MLSRRKFMGEENDAEKRTAAARVDGEDSY